MARKTHVDPQQPKDVKYKMSFVLPSSLHHFLSVEAKKIAEDTGKKCRAPDIVRALITAYYEKRMLGLLVNPDD